MGIDQLASGGDVPDDLDVDSLNTDDATINESVTWPDGSTTTTSPSGGGSIEVGGVVLVNGNGLGAASDDGWDTLTQSSFSTNFVNSFDSTPAVSIGLGKDNLSGGGRTIHGVTVAAANRSTTGFDPVFLNYSTVDFDAQNVGVEAMYVASEGNNEY